MDTRPKGNAKLVSGYASHPDSSNSHAYVDQGKWLQESIDVINKLAQRLPSTSVSSNSSDAKKLNTFADAYDFLAHERQRVAATLGHGKAKERTGDYGRLRTDGSVSFELVYETSQEPQPWLGMRDKLFALFREQLKRIKANLNEYKVSDSYDSDYDFRDDDCNYESFEGVDEQGRKCIGHEITIKSPIKELEVDGHKHSILLATITLMEYVDKADAALDPEFTHLRMQYIRVDESYRKGDFNLANRYYQALLEVNGTEADKLKSFMENAGRLAHLLSHLLPVALGNAAITEWMIRGLAFKKGIDLGPFNYSEGVSWDFKALLTPNREEYAEWFSKKAFAHVRMLTKEEREDGFLFRDAHASVTPQFAISAAGLGGFIQPAVPPTVLLHTVMPNLGGWYDFGDEGFALQCNDEKEAKSISEKLTKIFSELAVNVSYEVKPSNLTFIMLKFTDNKKLTEILNIKKDELAQIGERDKSSSLNVRNSGG